MHTKCGLILSGRRVPLPVVCESCCLSLHLSLPAHPDKNPIPCHTHPGLRVSRPTQGHTHYQSVNPQAFINCLLCVRYCARGKGTHFSIQDNPYFVINTYHPPPASGPGTMALHHGLPLLKGCQPLT